MNRTALLVLAGLLSGCLIPVEVGKDDAGGVGGGAAGVGGGAAGVGGGAAGVGGGAAGVGGGSGALCVLSDGGTNVTAWCLEQATNLRRCSDVALISCFEHPMAMAVDSTWLVWTTQGRGTYAREVAGGPVRKLDQGAEVSVSVAVRDGFAYWAESSSNASVYRLALNGGARETLATQQKFPRGLAVNATHAFWAAETTILRVELGAGAAQPFVSGENSPTGLALDATHLYWGNQLNGQIRRAPLTGGTPTTLFAGQALPWQLRVVNGYVYWNSDSANGDLKRGPVTGGTPEVLAPNQDVAREHVTDGVWLYWFAQGTNFGQPAPRIYRVPIAGGTPQIILTPKRGGPLALDGTTLYFGSEGVWSLPR